MKYPYLREVLIGVPWFSIIMAHVHWHIPPTIQTQFCLLLVSVLRQQVVSQFRQARLALPTQGVVVGEGLLPVVDGSQTPVGPEVDGVEHQVH